MPGIFTPSESSHSPASEDSLAYSVTQQHSGPERGWNSLTDWPWPRTMQGDTPGHLRKDSGSQAVTAHL